MSGDTDPQNYGKFLRRALAAYGKRLGDSDPEDLPQIVSLYEEMGRVIQETIRAQLLAGATWAQIAKALGLPVATAQSRWSEGGFRKAMVVYGLKEIGDSEIRYVGKSKNLGLRLAQHRNSAVYVNGSVGEWIRSIGGAANMEAVVLEEYEDEAAMSQGEHDWYVKLSETSRLVNKGMPSPTSVSRRPTVLSTDEIAAKRAERERVARERAAQRARTESNRERQDRAMHERAIARQAAYWDQEVAAGRAIYVTPPTPGC